MNTQQNEQDVQEVPELKSERVQDGLAAGKGEESIAIGLTRFKAMTVELPALGATVDIHGFAFRPVAG